MIEIRTDGGMEHQTLEVRKILEQERITLSICPPATSQQNGCSERLNLELQQKIRANLISGKIPNYYWVHAMNHVVHVHNRSPNKSIDFKSRYEMVKGVPPKLSHIRRFGRAPYYYDVHSKEKSKWEQRSKLAILLECTPTCYTLLDSVITRSKNVEFVESKVYGEYFGPDSILPFNEDLVFRPEDIQERVHQGTPNIREEIQNLEGQEENNENPAESVTDQLVTDQNKDNETDNADVDELPTENENNAKLPLNCPKLTSQVHLNTWHTFPITMSELKSDRS